MVTGAASGIGRALARGFAEAGACVAMIDIDGDGLEEEREKLSVHDAKVLIHKLDITDRVALAAAFSDIAQTQGRLDAVFANAGIGAGPGFARLDGTRNPAGALTSITGELWDKVLAVNLTAGFMTLQCAAEIMKAQGHGKIVFTTSIGAFRNESWVGTPYMPAKAGLSHLMRHAALELAGYGIQVNAIAPGFFATNIGGGKGADPSHVIERIPAGRIGCDRDVQGLGIFLASSASDYLTGVEIPLDGGMALGRPPGID